MFSYSETSLYKRLVLSLKITRKLNVKGFFFRNFTVSQKKLPQNGQIHFKNHTVNTKTF